MQLGQHRQLQLLQVLQVRGLFCSVCYGCFLFGR